MRPCRCARFCAVAYLDYFRPDIGIPATDMDYEAILESARRESGAEFVAAFARELAYEWCEIYEVMSERTTNGEYASRFKRSQSQTEMDR
jgi:hypothetical protein